MISLLAACLWSPPALSVEEFFPLIPGTKWTYVSDVGGNMASTQIDEVKAPVMIAEKEAFPIVTKVSGRLVGTSCYRIEGDTVYMVAEAPTKPFATPQPILKYENGKTNWKSESRWALARFEMPCA